MAQLKFSDRMDPTKQLRKEIPKERQWSNEFFQLMTTVTELCDAGRPYPAAVSEAKNIVNWS